MLTDILFALSITLLIEPILVSILKKVDYKLFISAFVVNLILNPLMNILLNVLNQDHYYVYLAIFEFSTIILETLIIFIIQVNMA